MIVWGFTLHRSERNFTIRDASTGTSKPIQLLQNIYGKQDIHQKLKGKYFILHKRNKYINVYYFSPNTDTYI